MFDRLVNITTDLPPEERFYFADDGETLVLPMKNIASFLSGQNSNSACKMLIETRRWKKVAQGLSGFVQVEPFLIPFTRNGKPLKFKGRWTDDIYVDRDIGRQGVPHEVLRPVVKTPWELSFTVRILPKLEELFGFGEHNVRDLFENGGLAVGLGTYRGVYGKFQVTKWE